MQQPFTEQHRAAAWAHTLQLINSGTPPQQVYEQLLQNGVPQSDAALFVQQALANQQPQPAAAAPAGMQPAQTQPAAQPASPQSPPTQKQLDDAWDTATTMVSSGVAPQTIYEIITGKGIPHQQAMDIISRARTQTDTTTGEVSDGKQDILYGALWLGGGLIITIGTYMMASNGGSYFITYGPVIYGVFRIIRGFTKL
ncbi:MAG: hypothetical protein ACK5Z2_04530 [Bacteroidota bacterium]|jgi:hypothetical protein